ncbi:forespore capture DNA-binding protein RefZ [Pontibacillus salicampi]|uniref:Forespore capture DNA-binding protein RefZ n=1 Tax=Pontibacillus salicampi TaxID=1449801 RepID=A0ABV6LIW4_9BACI
MTKTSTKQKVMDAASYLFYTQGYNGTSVRDIASKANVNVSLISYYFKNKQGLLEHLIVTYFEGYIDMLESVYQVDTDHPSKVKLCQMIEAIIQYKQKHYQFTCFIHRELTHDNVFVREMMVTYLAKEKYVLFNLFKHVLLAQGIKPIKINYYYIHLKGMVMTPFLMTYEMKEYVLTDHSHDFFIKQYSQTVFNWLEHICGMNTPKGYEMEVM